MLLKKCSLDRMSVSFMAPEWDHGLGEEKLPPIVGDTANRGCTVLPPLSEVFKKLLRQQQDHHEQSHVTPRSEALLFSQKSRGLSTKVCTQRHWYLQYGAAFEFSSRDLIDHTISSSSPTLSHSSDSGNSYQSYQSYQSYRSYQSSDRGLSPVNGIGSISPTLSKEELQREDRHEYDDEERFAIIYFRIEPPHRWKDIVEEIWPFLFPPGKLRRPSAPLPPGKSLPNEYPRRTTGGLQCRYYRVRADLGIDKVRKSNRAASPRYQDSQNCSDRSIHGLKLNLVRAWLQHISPMEITEYNLHRRFGENDARFWMRVTKAYEEHSEFWRLVKKVF